MKIPAPLLNWLIKLYFSWRLFTCSVSDLNMLTKNGTCCLSFMLSLTNKREPLLSSEALPRSRYLFRPLKRPWKMSLRGSSCSGKAPVVTLAGSSTRFLLIIFPSHAITTGILSIPCLLAGTKDWFYTRIVIIEYLASCRAHKIACVMTTQKQCSIQNIFTKLQQSYPDRVHSTLSG